MRYLLVAKFFTQSNAVRVGDLRTGPIWNLKIDSVKQKFSESTAFLEHASIRLKKR
jgi:hypothetical protein